MASVDAFADFAARLAALGFTDLVVHHPRADDPVWDYPPEIVDEIADRLPTLRGLVAPTRGTRALRQEAYTCSGCWAHQPESEAAAAR